MGRSGAKSRVTRLWHIGTGPRHTIRYASRAACLAASICRSRTIRECSKSAGSAEPLSQGLDFRRNDCALVAIAEMGADKIHHIGDLLVGEMSAKRRHALVTVHDHGEDVTDV